MTGLRKNSEVPNALVRLMQANFDPAGMSEADLIAAVAQARETKKRTEVVVTEELLRRGMSWRQIGAALGVDHTTPRKWLSEAGRLPDRTEQVDDVPTVGEA